MASQPRLSDLTPEQLRERARKCRDMIPGEASERLVAILMRLASRFDDLAMEREGTKSFRKTGT